VVGAWRFVAGGAAGDEGAGRLVADERGAWELCRWGDGVWVATEQKDVLE
jgi:hypothetical protein